MFLSQATQLSSSLTALNKTLNARLRIATGQVHPTPSSILDRPRIPRICGNRRTSVFSQRPIKNATSHLSEDASMTAAPAEKRKAGSATTDEAAKAAAAGHEESDGNQDQGWDQSDYDGPFICDCRLWYVACVSCCSLVSFGSPPI